MHELIDAIARLTGCKDRELLASRVASVLGEALQPVSLDLMQCVGEPPRLRCLAGLRRGEAPRPAEVAWTPLDELPTLAGRSTACLALAVGRPVLDRNEAGSAGTLQHVFPVPGISERAGLLELATEAPLDAAAQRLVRAVLEIYANQLGLLDYGECDTLTGLLNRKTFDEQFGKCLLADAVTGCPPGGIERRSTECPAEQHWLGMIDIDHFKRVNDCYGHLIGDEVLLLVAGLMRAHFRHSDQLYRFGGEEFVVLLRAADRASAARAFERFRARMAAFRFPQAGQVTVSIGFTGLRPHDTASAAFERADRAVYHAKQQGRDQLHCHEVLIEQGTLEASDRAGGIELF